MIPVSFCVRLHLGVSSSLAFSLLPSRRFYPLYAVPPPSSEGGEGAPAPRTKFAKVRTAVKPAGGGLPSSVTVQCQGTAPRHLPQGEGYALRSLRCSSILARVLKFLLPVFLSTGQELHVHKGVNEGSLRGKFFRKNLAGSADFTEQTALRIGNEHGHSYLCGSEHF